MENFVLVKFHGFYVYSKKKLYYYVILLHFGWMILEMSDKCNKCGKAN